MANRWMEHLKKVRKQNPNKSLGECMKIAKKSYTKKQKMPEKKHTKKWHRLVTRLKRQGKVKSPEAVATAVLGRKSYRKK